MCVCVGNGVIAFQCALVCVCVGLLQWFWLRVRDEFKVPEGREREGE